MKLFFVVTGIGLGHATREISIINEILKRDRKTKILIAGYKSSYTYFRRKKFKVIKLVGINYSSKNFNLNLFSIFKNNLKYPLNFRKDVSFLRQKMKKFDPDWVIVDWEPTGLLAASKAKKKSILIFNYNPYLFQGFIKKFKFGRFKTIQTRVIEYIYSFAERNSEAIFIPGFNNEKNNKFHFIDFIARNKYDELESEEILMQKLGLKRKPVLVMLGGSSFGYKLVEKLIMAMQEINEEFIIFGYNKKFKKRNIRAYQFNENYLEYLKVSKGVIMLAGHSSFGECAIFRKPCLVFPIKGHVEQMLNAYTVEEAGFGIVKYLTKINQDTLKNDLIDFLSGLGNLQKKADKLIINGNGAKQIADFLFSHKGKPTKS